MPRRRRKETAVAAYTASYAKALLAASKQADLVKADRSKRVAGLTAEQMARMEREMEALQQDLKVVESRYGDDVLHLVIASGYLLEAADESKREALFESARPRNTQ